MYATKRLTHKPMTWIVKKLRRDVSTRETWPFKCDHPSLVLVVGSRQCEKGDEWQRPFRKRRTRLGQAPINVNSRPLVRSSAASESQGLPSLNPAQTYIQTGCVSRTSGCLLLNSPQTSSSTTPPLVRSGTRRRVERTPSCLLKNADFTCASGLFYKIGPTESHHALGRRLPYLSFTRRELASRVSDKGYISTIPFPNSTPRPRTFCSDGLSNLLFAFAKLIIHFEISHPDLSTNNTNSYLDVSILYGSSEKRVNSVRRLDGTRKFWNDALPTRGYWSSRHCVPQHILTES